MGAGAAGFGASSTGGFLRNPHKPVPTIPKTPKPQNPKTPFDGGLFHQLVFAEAINSSKRVGHDPSSTKFFKSPFVSLTST